MNVNPNIIFEEYSIGTTFKSSIGNKGLFEQNRINERFYIGDQWYGAKCGNDRPLVRHNIIKRIGDYKISQILNRPLSVKFTAEGIDTENSKTNPAENSVRDMMNIFSNYFTSSAERLNLTLLSEKVLKNSFISGTGIIYTYWDSSVPTGLFADNDKKIPIRGDIGCEVLNIEDVVFGDPHSDNLQTQPYIIISCRKNIEDVLREARLYGSDLTALNLISEEAKDGKITVYTKLKRQYKKDGTYGIFASKTTEKSIVRNEFDTNLTLYPLSVFKWESRNNSAYGESEITYLIPNQIAINRMITANVWSAMTTGMPIMLVNGDTVTDKITNDPGQIIKVYGSQEDVNGAVKYVSPPSYMKDFGESVDSLIYNTLTQSGANEVALGDSQAVNATALITQRDSALMPMQTVKKRFNCFIEDLSRIWADFWISYYGIRKLKLIEKSGERYLDFNADNYKGIVISAKVDVNTETVYSEKECLQTLLTLFEKGIINREQLLKRMPAGIIPDISGLLKEDTEAV